MLFGTALPFDCPHIARLTPTFPTTTYRTFVDLHLQRVTHSHRLRLPLRGWPCGVTCRLTVVTLLLFLYGLHSRSAGRYLVGRLLLFLNTVLPPHILPLFVPVTLHLGYLPTLCSLRNVAYCTFPTPFICLFYSRLRYLHGLHWL